MGQDNVIRLGSGGTRPPDDPHWGTQDGYGYDDSYLDGPDDDLGPGGTWSSPDLGTLTEIIVMDDRVVDVRTRRAAGSEYECAALELGRGRPPVPPPPPVVPRPPEHECLLAWLALVAGGEESLARLDAEPLPEEDLDLAGVPISLHDALRSADVEISRVTDLVLGPEVRTAARRLLADAVRLRPDLVRPETPPEQLAAGAVVAVGLGNDLVGPTRAVTQALVRGMCGLRTAPGEKARQLAGAVAPHGPMSTTLARPPVDVLLLGSPRYLVAPFRGAVLAVRDSALRLRSSTPAMDE